MVNWNVVPSPFGSMASSFSIPPPGPPTETVERQPGQLGQPGQPGQPIVRSVLEIPMMEPVATTGSGSLVPAASPVSTLVSVGRLGRLQRLGVGLDHSQTEVSQLRVPVVGQQHVKRLDVAVQQRRAQ